MPPRLIVNADDFGLTRGINRAILELHLAGALTSATLMAKGPAFEDAAELARAHPTLGVGCHIVLTDGVPVSPPHTIPTLLGEDGQSFRPSLKCFVMAVLRGQINPVELQREIVAQIHTIQAAGLPITHLDTHKHTHILPAVARPLLEAAEATGVRAVRNPFEEPWSLRLSQTGPLRLGLAGPLRFGQAGPLRLLAVAATHLFRSSFLALPQIRRGLVVTPQGTLGISATGCLNQTTLERLLAALPEGLWELVCHPGYNDLDLNGITTRLRKSRDIERAALLSLLSSQNFLTQNSKLNQTDSKPTLRSNSPHPPRPDLIHYGRLIPHIEPESETLP